MRTQFESLDPRQLLAFTGTFTDVDGDTYKVELLGNGNAAVTTIDAGIDDGNAATGRIDQLTVTGTTAASRLRITVTVTQAGAGNGRVVIRDLNASILRSASMPAVDSNAGTLIFDNVGQLEFGSTSNSVDLDVNVNAPVVNLGKRTAKFGDLDNTGIDFGLAPATVSMKSATSTLFRFAQGAGRITSEGVFRSRLTSQASIGEIRVGGIATLRGGNPGSVVGDIRKISAASFGATDDPFTVTGVIGSLSSPGDFASNFIAGRFGSVTLGSMTSGQLASTTPDAKGVTFKSVKVTGGVVDSLIGTGNFGFAAGVDGLIGSLSAASWSGGSIRAAAIKTFKIAGNLQGADMAFSGTMSGLTLGSLVVGGQAAGGSLLIRGRAGPITLGSSLNGTPLSITDDGANAAFKSITLTSKTVVISQINVTAGSLGALSVAHGLISSQFNFGAASGFAVKTFKVVGQIQFMTINAPSTLGIDTFSARGLFTSNLSLGFINTLKLGKELNGASGGMENASLNLTGASAQGFSLKAADLGDKVRIVTISAETPGSGKLGSITAGLYVDTALTAPTIGSFTSTDKFNAALRLTIRATQAPASGFSIGTISIGADLLQSKIAAAGSINKVIVGDSTRGFATSFISAGNSTLLSAMPDNLIGFGNGSINQITYTMAYQSAIDDGEFSGTAFVASIIGNVLIKSRPNTTQINDGGQLFGFAASKFGSFKIATVAGVILQPTISTTPGDYNPLFPEVNGNLIVRVYPEQS